MKPLAALRVLAAAIIVCASAFAASARKKPGDKKLQGSIFVVNAGDGARTVINGKTSDLRQSSVIKSATGAAIIAAKESITLASSNGCGLVLSANTHLGIGSFTQGKIGMNAHPGDAMEPSQSSLDATLARGELSVCANRRMVGSSVVFRTRRGQIGFVAVRMVVRSDDNSCRVYVIEGVATVSVVGALDPLVINAGESVFIEGDGGDRNGGPKVSPIGRTELAELEAGIAMACEARKLVLFEMQSDQAGGAPDAAIKALRVIPLVTPVDFTVSRSRLP